MRKSIMPVVLALGLGAGVCLNGPAVAQDTLRPLSAFSTADELVEMLDSDEAAGIAFISGAFGSLLLRSAQGDPMLWWVQPCVSRNFIGAESLLEGVRVWADESDADHRMAELATNAVLYVLADECGQALGPLLPAE